MRGPRVFRLRTLASLAALALSAAPVAAQSTTGPRVHETLGASVNLLGIQSAMEAVWSRRQASLGLVHSVSPSYNRLGAWAQWAPHAAFDLRVGVEPALYHGFSGSLLSFDSADAPFDEDSRRARSDARVGVGGRAYVAPTVRARVRSVVATAGAELERWQAAVDEPFFYEPARDTVLRSSGQGVLRTNAAVMYERTGKGGKKILAGANHRLSRPFGAPGPESQRAGGIAVWTVGTRRLGLNDPTVVASVYRYLSDPYKEGEVGGAVALRIRLR